MVRLIRSFLYSNIAVVLFADRWKLADLSPRPYLAYSIIAGPSRATRRASPCTWCLVHRSTSRERRIWTRQPWYAYLWSLNL